MRQAIVKALDNAAVKALVFPEGGDVGENHHVAPIHPEYFALPPLVRDVEAAKALLAEAGKENLEITIDVGNTDGPWHQAVAEAMRDQLAEAGITLNVNVMPASKYWEIWTATPFGATAWTHRPLGTMVLSLGYRTGVAWNESGYANPEFDKALDEAEATLDVEARRAVMEKVEKILQDDAVDGAADLAAGLHLRRRQGAQLPAAPDALSPVQQGVGRRPDLTPSQRSAPRADRAQGSMRLHGGCPPLAPPASGMEQGTPAMLKLILQRLAQMVLIMAVVSLVLFAVFDSAEIQEAARRQRARRLRRRGADRGRLRATGWRTRASTSPSTSATRNGSAACCRAISAAPSRRTPMSASCSAAR